jgi:4'-phosphopantetheinyl transferase
VKQEAILGLAADQIDIWYCFLHRFGCDLDGWLAQLSGEEADRYRQIRSGDASRGYLAARVLTRSTLSRYAGVPHNAWRFTTNEHGRPRIDWPREYRDIHFNISHTAGLVVIAVGRIPEIGIDVETLDRDVEIDEIAGSILSEAEAHEWARGAPEARRDSFFSIWTLKEAYMKARGLGFSLPPRSFEFADLDGPISLKCLPKCDPDPGRWQFNLLRPGPEYKMAFAIGSRTVSHIRHLEWLPILHCL